MVDLSGFSGSADKSVPTSVSGYGPEFLALLDSRSLGSFSVLEHSLGGAIAQRRHRWRRFFVQRTRADQVVRQLEHRGNPNVLHCSFVVASLPKSYLWNCCQVHMEWTYMNLTRPAGPARLDRRSLSSPSSDFNNHPHRSAPPDPPSTQTEPAKRAPGGLGHGA